MGRKNIIISFSKEQPVKGIQLLKWSGNYWDNISYFPEHYQIGAIRKGAGEFKTENVLLPIKQGEYFFIHPGKIHSGKPDFKIGWAADCIVIKTEFVKQFFNKKMPVFDNFVFFNKEISEAFSNCFELLSNYKNSIEDENQLAIILINLLSIQASNLDTDVFEGNENEAIKRATNYIDAHFKENFSLDALSARCYMSKFHLLRTFKKVTGLTPYTYQVHLRLNEARKLIFSNKSFTEIAFELGFADQAHFTNTFKKHANGANPSNLLKTAIFYNFKE